MQNFTPISGLIGGLLIGLASALLLLFNGRIAGISGIVGGVLQAPNRGTWWRLAFAAGLVVGPLIVFAWRGEAEPIALQVSWPWMIAAGLLVGFGTQLGGGCTSGHGVCGISLGSRRSISATAVFFVVAAVTVFLARHEFGA